MHPHPQSPTHAICTGSQMAPAGQPVDHAGHGQDEAGCSCVVTDDQYACQLAGCSKCGSEKYRRQQTAVGYAKHRKDGGGLTRREYRRIAVLLGLHERSHRGTVADAQARRERRGWMARMQQSTAAIVFPKEPVGYSFNERLQAVPNNKLKREIRPHVGHTETTPHMRDALPCPNPACRSTYLQQDLSMNVAGACIKCGKCGMSGPKVTRHGADHGANDTEAMELWNGFRRLVEA
jgi:hypothetical protein